MKNSAFSGKKHVLFFEFCQKFLNTCFSPKTKQKNIRRTTGFHGSPLLPLTPERGNDEGVSQRAYNSFPLACLSLIIIIAHIC